MYYVIGASVPSLHREATDSLIQCSFAIYIHVHVHVCIMVLYSAYAHVNTYTVYMCPRTDTYYYGHKVRRRASTP